MVSLGLTKVIFELDCKLVVDRVKNMFKDDSEVGVMITTTHNPSGCVSVCLVTIQNKNCCEFSEATNTHNMFMKCNIYAAFSDSILRSLPLNHNNIS